MSEENNLESRIKEWINKEGIPLEYFTSSLYNNEKFRVTQSDFVIEKGNPREIDVSASITYKLDEDSHLRIYNIVECKWSKNKPWIVFTSKNTRMSESARIAQSFGSEVGNSLLWLLAGEKNLYEIDLFKEDSGNGFSGRQSFSKDNDLFYSSIQSLITKTLIKLSEYDNNLSKNPFDFIAIGFPTIVIDGLLYETDFDSTQNKIELKKVNHSRVQWKGSSQTKFHSVIDIVTKDYLSEYVKSLKNDFDLIANQSKENLKNLKNFYSSQNTEDLKIKNGARGMIGLPKFIWNNRIK